MKKVLFIILIMFFVAIGCSKTKQEEKDESKKLSNGLVLKYEIGAMQGPEDGPVDEIELYANKLIIFRSSDLEGWSQKQLTEDQYQKIIDYIRSDEFLALKDYVNNNIVGDGYYHYISIYYEDGSIFKVGGQNFDNEVFLKLVYLLKQYN